MPEARSSVTCCSACRRCRVSNRRRPPSICRSTADAWGSATCGFRDGRSPRAPSTPTGTSSNHVSSTRLRMRLVSGRDFSQTDTAHGPASRHRHRSIRTQGVARSRRHRTAARRRATAWPQPRRDCHRCRRRRQADVAQRRGAAVYLRAAGTAEHGVAVAACEDARRRERDSAGARAAARDEPEPAADRRDAACAR